MRKSLYIFLLVMLNVFIANAQSENGYKITAKFKSIDPNKTYYLAHYYGNTQYLKIDSTKANNGVLEFKGKEPLKGGIYLVVLSESKYYDIMVSGNEKEFSFEADTADYIKSVKFTGSKENDIIFNYRKFLASKSDEAMVVQKVFQNKTEDKTALEMAKLKMKTLQDEVNAYMKNVIAEHGSTFAGKVIKANMEPELPNEAPKLANGKTDSTFMFNTYKRKFFDNIDFTDERMLRTPFIQNKVEKYFKDLVYQVTDSVKVDADKVLKLAKKDNEVYRFVLWMISNKYENNEIVGLDGVFIHLAENYYLKDAYWLDSAQRAKFQERVDILKPIETGKLMPNFLLQDTLGRERNAYDVKSKYTIVYFYSPDCGHCKDHAPDLVKYYDENKSKNIEIYNIAIDHDDPKKVKDFIKTYKTGKMVNLWDSKNRYDFRKKYDVYSTPTSFILDANKRIIAKRLPLEEINKFIDFHEKKEAEIALKKGK